MISPVTSSNALAALIKPSALSAPPRAPLSLATDPSHNRRSASAWWRASLSLGYARAGEARKVRAVLKTLAGAVITVALLATAAADDALRTVLDARAPGDAARDVYRHPEETMAFFGLRPGMTVVETLPGGGWYTRILVPYIGPEGKLYGATYSLDIWRRIFGERWQARRAAIEGWAGRFPAQAAAHAETPPVLGAFVIGQAPAELTGQVDQVLFIRSLHHLNRYEPAWLDAAAAEAHVLLKPGGVVGVVQHRAPESASEPWANGDNGYLKASRVIAAFEGAGLVLEASSEINANARDRPSEQDRVWRLPPTLSTADESRAANLAIGESDRMTLRFRKPG